MFKKIVYLCTICFAFLTLNANAIVIDTQFYRVNFDNKYTITQVSDTKDAFYFVLENKQNNTIISMFIIEDKKPLEHYKRLIIDGLLEKAPGFSIARYTSEYHGLECIDVPLTDFRAIYTFASDGDIKAFLRYEGKSPDEELSAFFKNFKSKKDLTKVLPKF